MKLKKGDKVKILIGKDKGREGLIERVFSKKSTIVVPGVNVYKKHVKGSPGQKSGIYDFARPLASSKVALICPRCKKQTRVKFKYVGDKKVRICAKCEREVDVKVKKNG